MVRLIVTVLFVSVAFLVFIALLLQRVAPDETFDGFDEDDEDEDDDPQMREWPP